MATVISLKGIDEAISNLNYKDNKTLKYKLVHIIREFYESEGAVTTLQDIDKDEFVKALWDTGDDPSTIKSKRKNLSSIKSSVNADFKRLYEDDKNPEGIIIGRTNVFIMSDEAKDRLLTSFTGSAKKDGGVTLEQINEVLNIVHEVLSDPEVLANTKNSDRTGKLSQLKNIVHGLSQKLGLKDGENPPLSLLGKEGLPGEKDDALARISEDTAKTGAGQTGDEAKTSAIAGSGVAGYGPGADAGVDVDVGMIPADEQESAVTVTAAATEKPGYEENLEEIAADEVDVVDTIEPVEEIVSEEGLESEKLEDIGGVREDSAETESVEDIGAAGTGDDLEEVEVVKDIEEKTPEEVEEVVEDDAEIADEADLPEEAAPDEAEPIEEIEESEVEESLQEVKIVDDRAEAEAGEADLEEGLAEVGTGDDLEKIEAAEDLEEITSEGSEETTAGEAAVVDEAGDIEEIRPEEAKNSEAPVEKEAAVVEETRLVEDEGPEEELPPEEMEDIEEITEDEVEELEIPGNDAEPGLAAGGSEAGYSDSVLGEDNKILRARLLAEEFNCLLGARERFYNQYILIPAGEYIVGNKSPGKDERLEQKVRLTSFYMGKFPVTNALFEVFIEKTGYKTTAEKCGYGKVYYGRFKKTADEKTGSVRLICRSGLSCETVYGACWHQPSGPGSTIHNKRNHPVVQVSLEDAMAFAAWTGKRLPAEDEWEAAARTAAGYVLPWGNDWQRDACNIEDRAIADTTPVDRYLDFENNFGIVDAIGNVLEWTMEPCKPPSHAKHDVKYYVAKGGAWISGSDIRLFNRFKLEAELHSNILGVRCVAY